MTRRHHPRAQHNEEQRYGKLKLTMAKFSGRYDPEEYLSWALKVDKIFRMHNYEEEKKIAMASLEFQDYVLIWWEQVIVIEAKVFRCFDEIDIIFCGSRL